MLYHAASSLITATATMPNSLPANAHAINATVAGGDTFGLGWLSDITIPPASDPLPGSIIRHGGGFFIDNGVNSSGLDVGASCASSGHTGQAIEAGQRIRGLNKCFAEFITRVASVWNDSHRLG